MATIAILQNMHIIAAERPSDFNIYNKFARITRSKFIQNKCYPQLNAELPYWCGRVCSVRTMCAMSTKSPCFSATTIASRLTEMEAMKHKPGIMLSGHKLFAFSNVTDTPNPNSFTLFRTHSNSEFSWSKAIANQIEHCYCLYLYLHAWTVCMCVERD